MTKKPSLGDNPLSYNFRVQGNFDFIRNLRENEELAEDLEKASGESLELRLDKEIIEKIIALAGRQGKPLSILINELLRKSLEE